MKHHQPLPIAIYENVGAKVAATANFARLLAPTRFLDAMNPGDRAANIDLVHFCMYISSERSFDVILYLIF